MKGRNFIIFTDHKPLIFAFNQNLDKCSPHQFRYLDYVGQFTTNIRHIKSLDNNVADTLSRVETIAKIINHQTLGSAQKNDSELRDILGSETSALKLKKVYFPDYNIDIYSDVMNNVVRPYVSKSLRSIFYSLHGLSHPGIRATQKFITGCFVWPY